MSAMIAACLRWLSFMVRPLMCRLPHSSRGRSARLCPAAPNPVPGFPGQRNKVHDRVPHSPKAALSPGRAAVHRVGFAAGLDSSGRVVHLGLLFILEPHERPKFELPYASLCEEDKAYASALIRRMTSSGR